jgi:serine/threonine protein kinase
MVGTRIEHYEIIERLGQGGMGAVYRATDTLLEREVALKLLRPEYAADPLFAERFRAEAVTLAKLSHPNIATLFGFGRDPAQLYMIMELATGETLGTLLKRTGALSWERAILLTGQMLDALQYAHERGVVHRDIKPSNLMVGDDDHLKLMDFGIARLMGTTRVTQMGFTVGTLEYMAPEQIRGEDVDGRADIYATGVVLYEMVTGQLPFKSSREQALMFAHLQQEVVPPRTHRPNLPWHLSDVIVRALAKAPGDRYSSAREFSDALGASASSLPATSPVRVPTAGHTVTGSSAAPRRRTSPSRAVASAGVAYMSGRDDDATRTAAIASGKKQGFFARWWPSVQVSSNKFGGAHEPGEMYQVAVGAGGFAGAIRIVAVRMGTAGRKAATTVTQAIFGASHVLARRPAIVAVAVILALAAGGWYWRQRRVDPNAPHLASVIPTVSSKPLTPASVPGANPTAASPAPIESSSASAPSAPGSPTATPAAATSGIVAPTVEPASATLTTSVSGAPGAPGAPGAGVGASAPASGTASAAKAHASGVTKIAPGVYAPAGSVAPAPTSTARAAGPSAAPAASTALAGSTPAAGATAASSTIAAADKAPLPPPAEPDLKLENEVTWYAPKNGDIEEIEGNLTVHGNEIVIVDGDEKVVKTVRLRADRPGSGPAASGPARIFSHRRTRWLVLPVGADQFVVQIDRDDVPKLMATLEARLGRPVTMVDGEPQFPKTK